MIVFCHLQDTGRYTRISEAILYIVRLCVRVEGFLLFLIKNRNFHNLKSEDMYNGAYQEAQVRGLDSSDSMVEEALDYQTKIRALLDNRILKIIARWIKRAKKSGQIVCACMLHAHLAFLYKNVEAESLDDRKIFSMIASQVYILSNLNIDLDASKTDSGVDLGIPYLELYDMFQRNRNKIVTFLDTSVQTRNMVPFL